MKRLLFLALALCTVAAPLAACADPVSEETSAVTESAESVDTTAVTEAPEVTESEETDPVTEPAVAEDEPSLVDLRKELTASGADIGIAYLGYCDGAFADIETYLGELGLYELYPFTADLTSDSLIENGAGELYLVVPESGDVSVKVYSAVMNTESYETEKGELLGESAEGEPFIVNCGVSEVMASVIIETAELTYAPCISGEDGSLITVDGVYDFSPYEAVKEYFGL